MAMPLLKGANACPAEHMMFRPTPVLLAIDEAGMQMRY